jgi:hypothetical protein
VKGIFTVTDKILDAAVQLTLSSRLQARARWLGWRLVECPNETWAAVDLHRDDVRFPNAGGIDLKTMEQFLEAREREPVF